MMADQVTIANLREALEIAREYVAEMRDSIVQSECQLSSALEPDLSSMPPNAAAMVATVEGHLAIIDAALASGKGKAA